MVEKRQTKQKTTILHFLESVYSHPTAEKVYHEVKKQIPNITLATVYRNLHSLAEDGVILKIEANGEYHFDAHTSHHQHCICKKCGKIMDFNRENISRYALKHLDEDEFQPDEVQVIYRGTCKQCA